LWGVVRSRVAQFLANLWQGLLRLGPVEPSVGGRSRQIRRLALCVGLVGSRRICPAHVGCAVDPDGTRRTRRIVWMTKRMIKQARQLDERVRVEHKISDLVLCPQGGWGVELS